MTLSQPSPGESSKSAVNRTGLANESPGMKGNSLLPQAKVADYQQSRWTEETETAAKTLIKIAIEEDLKDQRDWSSFCSISPTANGSADLAARSPGVVCGLKVVPLVLECFNKRTGAKVQFTPLATDGDSVSPGTVLGRLEGNAIGILTAERTLLNFMGRMSGIATLTSKYAKEIHGSGAKLYDTRKTTPGWRLLEKYSVAAGGGHNHRMGLYAAVMLKDNHLAESTEVAANGKKPTFAQVIQSSQSRLAGERGIDQRPLIFEVEVDSLEQFRQILPLNVDIILLDNMALDDMKKAVSIRKEAGSRVQLEASGNVKLSTIAAIAATGVDRISSGSLTHSATNWDVGLDWAGG